MHRTYARLCSAVTTLIVAALPFTIPAPAAAAVVDPTALDFGTVAVGSTTTLPVRLTISAGYVGYSFFGIVGSTVSSFSPDGGCGGATGPTTCTVNVTFKPTALGQHSATLYLYDCPVGGGLCNTNRVDLAGAAGTPPAVTSVAAATANGGYKAGDTLSVTVTYDQAVTVDTTDGTPTVQLETGTVDEPATYSSGSGTNTLTFTYTVQAGDATGDLDYTGTDALTFNGGTVRATLTGATANRELPAPGGPGSLAANAALVLDTLAPSATLTLDDAHLTPGQSAQLDITLTEPVIGLTLADLTADAGTLSNLATTDNLTYSATLTPAASTSSAGNKVILDLAGVTDAVGNSGVGTAATPAYTVDTAPRDFTAPTSHATGPTLTDTATWTVSYTASDTGFGVTTVDLYAKAPGAATYTKVANDTTVRDGQFPYTATAGDGGYAFYTIATDAAGNVEAAPTPADVNTELDTTVPDNPAPVLAPRMGAAPVHFDISAQAPLALRARVNELASMKVKIRARGTLVRAWPWRHDVRGLVEQPWNGRVDGHRVAEGRYRVVFVAIDAAGNRSVARVPLRVTH